MIFLGFHLFEKCRVCGGKDCLKQGHDIAKLLKKYESFKEAGAMVALIRYLEKQPNVRDIDRPYLAPAEYRRFADIFGRQPQNVYRLSANGGIIKTGIGKENGEPL